MPGNGRQLQLVILTSHSRQAIYSARHDVHAREWRRDRAFRLNGLPPPDLITYHFMMVFDSVRNCYRYWWSCLPAIPASRESRDWWAPESSRRATPYRRLRRVWNDATWFKRPKADRLRRHEFSTPVSGTHMTVQLWENWTLFHPTDWLPGFLREIGMDEGRPGPWDACWSYEYEDRTNSKLPDITLHVRDGRGHETLFVIEAKWNKDRLKTSPRIGLPDSDPEAYIHLTGFEMIEDRRMVYLVHARDAAHVRAEVERSAGARPWGIYTWERMISQQCQLSRSLLPQPFADLVRDSILRQAAVDCVDRAVVNGSCDSRDLPTPGELAARFAIEEMAFLPDRFCHYASGARSFWLCRTDPSCLPARPFPYLAEEPSFPELHDQIAARKAGKVKPLYLLENPLPLWSLDGPGDATAGSKLRGPQPPDIALA